MCVALLGHGALRAGVVESFFAPAGGTDEPEHRTGVGLSFWLSTSLQRALSISCLIQSLPPKLRRAVAAMAKRDGITSARIINVITDYERTRLG